MSLGKRKKTAVVNDEGGEQNEPAAARRKGAKGAAMGSSFGDVLQKALERKLPKGSKGPAVGSGAKDSAELKKRIKKDKEAREEKMILAEKRKWFQKEHVTPEAADMNHEKLLLKLATKGVVKLFNVIQQQQKTRMEEKGKADAAPKPDKMTKSQFLNMLKSGGKVAEAEAEETEEFAAPRRGKAAEEDAESDGMEEEDEEEEEEEVEEEEVEEEEVEEGAGEESSDSGGEMEAEDDEEEWD